MICSMIRIFLYTDYIYSINNFILILCSSIENSIKCHESEFDLLILNLVNDWREKIIQIIPENKEELISSNEEIGLQINFYEDKENIIIENENGIVISEKLINSFLNLFSQICCIDSSYSIIQNFFSLLQPLNDKCLSPIHKNLLCTLNNILISSKYYPAQKLNPFVLGSIPLSFWKEGFSIVFWILIPPGIELNNQSLFAIIDEKQNKVRAYFYDIRSLRVEVQYELKSFHGEFYLGDIPKGVWQMLTISTSRDMSTTVYLNDKQFAQTANPDIKYKDNSFARFYKKITFNPFFISEIFSDFHSDEPSDSDSKSFIFNGYFMISNKLSHEKILSIFNESPRASIIRIEGKVYLKLSPKNWYSINDLCNYEKLVLSNEYYSSFNYIINFFRKEYLILLLFKQLDIPFKNGFDNQFKPEFLVEILGNFLGIGLSTQFSTQMYGIIESISHILEVSNQSHLTFNLYLSFFSLYFNLIKFNCLSLNLTNQKCLINVILLNFNIWSKSDLENQIKIIELWKGNDEFFKSIKTIDQSFKPIEWILNTIHHFYYTHDIDDQRMINCRQLLFDIAFQDTNNGLTKNQIQLIFVMVLIEDLPLKEKKEMLDFLAKIIPVVEIIASKPDDNEIENLSIIPFIYSVINLENKDDELIYQAISILVSIKNLSNIKITTPLYESVEIIINLLLSQKYVIKEDTFSKLISIIETNSAVELLPLLCQNAVLGGVNYLNILLNTIDRSKNYFVVEQSIIYPIFLLFEFYSNPDFYHEIIKMIITLFENNLIELIYSISIPLFSYIVDPFIVDSIKHDLLIEIIRRQLINQEIDRTLSLTLCKITINFIFFRVINSQSNLMNLFLQSQYAFENHDEYNKIECNNLSKYDLLQSLYQLILDNFILDRDTLVSMYKFGLRLSIDEKWLDLDLAKSIFSFYFKYCSNELEIVYAILKLCYFIDKFDRSFVNTVVCVLQKGPLKYYVNGWIMSMIDSVFIQALTDHFNKYLNNNLFSFLSSIIANLKSNLNNEFYFVGEEKNKFLRKKDMLTDILPVFEKCHNYYIQTLVNCKKENKKLFEFLNNYLENFQNSLPNLIHKNSDEKFKRDNCFSFAFCPCKLKRINCSTSKNNIKINDLQRTELNVNEQKCKLITFNGEKESIIRIENDSFHIITEYKTKIIPFNKIQCIFKTSSIYNNPGFQIFTKTRKNYLLLFNDHDLSSFYHQITLFHSKFDLSVHDMNEYTNNWLNGKISNFEYLMQLNICSGRSFNDKSQYPVFPWIISDFSSQSLDIKNEKIYRDLSKPVGALNEQRLESLKKEKDDKNKSYLFEKSYSNKSYVDFWLYRIEYTKNDNENCQILKSIADSYSHAITNQDDFRELIPEFYFFPYFLTNINKLKSVDDVILPKWANKSAVEFIYLHRKALESNYVSSHLDEWIDLIWGFKQNGIEAIKANNTFDDSQTNKNIIPLKLFDLKHPKRGTIDLSSSIPAFKAIDGKIHYSIIKFADCDKWINHSVFYSNENKLIFTNVDEKLRHNTYFIDYRMFNEEQFIAKPKISKSKILLDKTWNLISNNIDPERILFTDKDCTLKFVNVRTLSLEKTFLFEDDDIYCFIVIGDWILIKMVNGDVSLFNIKELFNSELSSFKIVENNLNSYIGSFQVDRLLYINPIYNAAVFESCDRSLLFCSLKNNRIEINKIVDMNEVAINFVITDTFGFVVVSSWKIKNHVKIYKLSLFNLGGEIIRSVELDNNMIILHMIKATSSPGSIDFLIVSDNTNSIYVLEAFYLKLGKPIFKCDSNIVNLKYIKEESLIVAFCANGTAAVIYYPIVM